MSEILAALFLLQQSATGEKPRTPAEVLQKAEQLIDSRETPGHLEEAIELLNRHASDSDASLPLWIALAEAQALLVDTYDLGKADQNRKHQEHREAGKLAAQKAVAMDPQSGPAHYWYGLLLLYSSDAEQSYSRLKQALRELEIADARSPGIDDAGPARMLGRIYQQTPGWPFLGSTSKSIEYLERARKAAPDNLRNALWLGLSYESAGKARRAKEQLGFVVASKNHSGREQEEEALKKEAAEHLKKLGSK